MAVATFPGIGLWWAGFLQSLNIEDAAKLASSGVPAILVYAVSFVVAGLMAGIGVLYKALREEAKQNRDEAQARLLMYQQEVALSRQSAQETQRLLIELTSSVALHIKTLESIPALLREHESNLKEIVQHLRQ